MTISARLGVVWFDGVRTHSAPVNLFCIQVNEYQSVRLYERLYDLMLMPTDEKNKDLASSEAFIRPAQDSRFKYSADKVKLGGN